MELYKIKLNQTDLKILSENLDNGLLKEKLFKFVENFGQLHHQIVSFDETQIDEITDCLSELFCKRGLLESDEPNDFGYYIESLIDRFSIE